MVRRLLLVTLVLAGVLVGVAIAWVALSVPRDVRAEAMLREARTSLENGERDAARRSFRRVLRDYPRTDAAAAALFALLRIDEQELASLRARIDRLERQLADERDSAPPEPAEAESAPPQPEPPVDPAQPAEGGTPAPHRAAAPGAGDSV
ncbi:MAG TPA: hypothetical protein VMS56_06955 [Thermoanaerobaculia bacterium]|nr:hypothetical protein [Thermoanaerobaculia bacterium]